MRLLRWGAVVLVPLCVAAGWAVAWAVRTAPSTPAEPYPLPDASAASVRVADLAGVTGLVYWAPGDGLRAPDVVLYGDGTVVVAGLNRMRLDPAAYGVLVATVRSGLRGVPDHPHSDVVTYDATTTVGVRFEDGDYRFVTVDGIEPESGYPRGVLDAFNALAKLGSAFPEAEPYRSDEVVVGYGCEVHTHLAASEPWPADLPMPPADSYGNACSAVDIVSGETATTVRTGCANAYTPIGSAAPLVPQGPRCIWRYALPDEH
jgi:hypothetical protein